MENKSVISKIEITKNTKNKTMEKGKEKRSISLKKYHSKVDEIGDKLVKDVLSLCPNNLLTCKMAMMDAVRKLEDKIKERSN